MERPGNISLRFCVVGGIALVLLVPLLMINGLADEREAYFVEAASHVAAGWGDAQHLIGPLIVIPRLHRQGSDGWRIKQSNGHREDIVLVARGLDTNTALEHHIRQRGIFAVPVYRADIEVTGEFDLSQAIYQQDLDWQNAKLVLGISSAKGIRDAVLMLDQQPVRLQAGTTFDWLGDGLHTQVDLTPGKHSSKRQLAFNFTLVVRGLNSFSATLPGARSILDVQSTWPHPSFGGRFLPDSSTVSQEGFTAHWAAHELARGFPASWIAQDDLPALYDKAVSIELYAPMTPYRSVERGIKYGVLFLAATFLTLLSFELNSRIRFHFVQYGVMGAALVLFYLTLLSLAEHIHFGAAFFVATAVVLCLTGWYMQQVTGDRNSTLIFLSMLAAVYTILYMLLRMEDYALLAGTFALMLGLVVLMWVTRNLADHPTDTVSQQ